jgi:hypothetical protein
LCLFRYLRPDEAGLFLPPVVEGAGIRMKKRHWLLAMLVLCSFAIGVTNAGAQAPSDPPGASALGGGSQGPAPDSGEPDVGDQGRQRLVRNSVVPHAGELRSKWQWWFGRYGIIRVSPFPWIGPIVMGG